MKIKTLSGEETRQYGFTHKVSITFEDLNTTAGLTKVLTAIPNLGVGNLITAAAFRLVTPFVGASITSTTLEVGYNLATGTDDPNGIIEAAELVGASKVLIGDATGAIFAAKRTGFAPQEACTIEALFTAVGANLTALTAGEVNIFLSIVNLSKL